VPLPVRARRDHLGRRRDGRRRTDCCNPFPYMTNRWTGYSPFSVHATPSRELLAAAQVEANSCRPPSRNQSSYSPPRARPVRTNCLELQVSNPRTTPMRSTWECAIGPQLYFCVRTTACAPGTGAQAARTSCGATPRRDSCPCAATPRRVVYCRRRAQPRSSEPATTQGSFIQARGAGIEALLPGCWDLWWCWPMIRVVLFLRSRSLGAETVTPTPRPTTDVLGTVTAVAEGGGRYPHSGGRRHG